MTTHQQRTLAVMGYWSPCHPLTLSSSPLHFSDVFDYIPPVPQPVLAVISVLGKDQKGVVAQFATYIAERGVNIEDIEQRVVRGFFVMDMLVDLKDLSSDLSEVITGLLELGRRIDMEVRVVLQSERRRKRIALLVSKEPHCLQQLIDDSAHGKLHGEIACVLSNPPDLEPIAKSANLRFASHPADDPEKHFAWLHKALA